MKEAADSLADVINEGFEELQTFFDKIVAPGIACAIILLITLTMCAAGEKLVDGITSASKAIF